MVTVTKAELVLSIAVLKGQLATARAERDTWQARAESVTHHTPVPSRAEYYTYVARCRKHARDNGVRVCSYKTFADWSA